MTRSAVAVVGLAFVLVTSCGGSSSTPAPGTSSASPTTTARPAYVVASLDAGNTPCAVEGGFGSVWVSVYGDDTVLRIDPESREVIAHIDAGIAPCGIAVGGGSVWVENYGGNSVTRIDPRTDKATEIPVGRAPYDVTYAAGAAWTTNFGEATVSRVDARTGEVRAVKVGDDPVGIAPAGGAVWVSNQGDGTLSRIDPASLHVRTRRFGPGPSWTAWGDGELWVAQQGGMGLVDPARGTAARTAQLPGQPNDGDIADGVLWVPDRDGSLNALSADDGHSLGRWNLGLGNPFVAAVYADLVWVVDFLGTEVVAVDPGALDLG
jgi:YVTN family beta-propeller protein